MNVCPECFQNETLKKRMAEIRRGLPSGDKCDFHTNRKAVPLDEVGKIVDPAFRANFGFGEWRYRHQEGQELFAVLEDMTGATEEPIITELIEWLVSNDFYWPPDGDEAFYDTDQAYVPVLRDEVRHRVLWNRFQKAILHRQRFFNDLAKEFLREIFDGIQHQTDVNGRPTFYRVTPDDGPVLYRARVVADEMAFR